MAQLDDLVVSDSLSCSFCNAIFEDQVQQRLHYKLDWHRYNLKQHLGGLKSISEGSFNQLADKGKQSSDRNEFETFSGEDNSIFFFYSNQFSLDDVSSISGSDSESENDDETGTSETGSSRTETKTGSNRTASSSILISNDGRSKKDEGKKKAVEFISDSSDTELDEDALKKKRAQELVLVASRHSKVFFENDEGNIFSIYRCLLHNKKVFENFYFIVYKFTRNNTVFHTNILCIPIHILFKGK